MTITQSPNRWIMRGLLAVFYAYAGFVHLRSPEFFLPIVPGWVPEPKFVVIATGLCEIAGAIALMTGRLRYAAGVMLALYAVCVYPANIKHALDSIAIGGTKLGWGYHGPRLAFQPVFVWWALFAGAVIDWPFGRRRAA
ncbi:MAG: DoxX family protein [Pseudomonadota bacterium]